MSTREILTLQFGHYTNYVGAHFWNIQELGFDYTGTVKSECNTDILYREGQNVKGEVTYTPRLLLADLKGSLNTLPTNGGFSNDSVQDDFEWNNFETIQESRPEKNDFLVDIETEPLTTVNSKQYNLDNDVQTWTDFLYPRLHSRTINIVNEYKHGDYNECFDIFSTGCSIWKSDYGEIFADNIRKYVEECDSTQGFQVNFDCTDGFAGLALSSIEHLADEYSKPILVHPIIASYFPDNNATTQEERDISNLKDSIRLVNIAISIVELSQFATLFVPICTGEKGWKKPGNARSFEYLSYNSELYYNSSAVLASALDTLSQKYRLKSNQYTLSDLCSDITGYGRKMAAASLRLPFAINESQYLIDFLNDNTKPIYTPITPSCKISTDKIFQLITVRGVPESYLKAPIKEAKNQMNLPAYSCTNVKEMFELYFQANNFLSATDLTVCEKPLELKTPYPKIFSESLNKYGFISNNESPVKLESCAVIAGYHNGNFMSEMIEKLHRETHRIKFAKLHKFKQEGLEESEYKESLDRLAEFKDNYEDDFEL